MKTLHSWHLRAARVFFLFPLALLIFTLFSCPKIIDEALVRAVVDSLAPVVKITTPLPNEAYSSTVTVIGTVTDDSIAAGDNDGIISSIAFEVANTFRRGKINISTTGIATRDDNYGTGTIDWLNDTKTFSFQIDTVNPSMITGPMVISITVEDTNRNQRIVELTLLESSGPYIDLEEPGNTVVNYQQGITHLDIFGTIGNSVFDKTSASEVKSLSWRSGTRWYGDLDLDPASPGWDWDEGRGLFVTDNEGFFVPEEFTFDPDPNELEFRTGFFVPSGAGDIMQIEVSAEDYNGHVSSVMVFLYEDTSGPQVTIISVNPFNATDGKSYYSSINYPPKPVVIDGNVLPKPLTTVSTFRYEVIGPGGYSDSGTINTATEPGFGTFAVNGMFTLTMDDIDLTGLSSFATITLLVTDDQNATTRATFQVFEDGAAPVISPGTMIYSNPNSSYAKVGNAVTLTFMVDDGGKSGVDGIPEVWIAGHDRTANVIPQGGNVYAVSHVMLAGDGTDADVTFTIDSVDIVGNVSTTVTQATGGSQNVMFYEGDPTLSNVWIESDNPNSDWSKIGDLVTLHFHSNRDLLSDPSVGIAMDPSVAVDNTSAPDYEASYQMTGSDAEGTVSFSVDFTDAAGNAVTVPVTGITMGANVTFDKTPPAVVTGAIEGPAIVFSPASGWRPIGSSITKHCCAFHASKFCASALHPSFGRNGPQRGGAPTTPGYSISGKSMK